MGEGAQDQVTGADATCLSHRTSGTPCAGRNLASPLDRWVGVGGPVFRGDTQLPLQGPGHETAATQSGAHGDEDGVQGSRSGGGPAEVPRWVLWLVEGDSSSRLWSAANAHPELLPVARACGCRAGRRGQGRRLREVQTGLECWGWEEWP